MPCMLLPFIWNLFYKLNTFLITVFAITIVLTVTSDCALKLMLYNRFDNVERGVNNMERTGLIYLKF